MGDNSKIEWTDTTWNPVTGCSKVGQGCKFCYAERIFHRPYPGRDFTDVQCHPERLTDPLTWKKPRRVFVNSISDLFHVAVPFHFIDKICGVTHACPGHTFQILTKRPERMLEYDRWVAANNPHAKSWPPNVWLGVSVEDQKTADERIPLLLQAPAALRFVSYEPALGPVDFCRYLDPSCSAFNRCEGAHVEWLICGGESGPRARPSHPDWFRAVRDQCYAARVPFFFKQWGEWIAAGQETGWTPEYVREVKYCHWIGGQTSAKVGKRFSGRLLDGREWNEFPKGECMSPSVGGEA